MGTFRKFQLATLAGVALALLSNSATGDGLRCGRKLVRDGDSVQRLLERCGEPARKFTARRQILGAGNSRTHRVQNWVYERGHRLTMIVSISDGVIVSIEPE